MPAARPLCDIVVPIWNQPELTGRCLQSVARHSADGTRLILVDNGSDRPTRELLVRFAAEQKNPPAVILRNPVNLGFIRASNQGILASAAEWVCLLNNDTVVTAGWLTEMLKVARCRPEIGLVNPTSNSLGFDADRGDWDGAARLLRPQSGRWTELSTALGFCLLARRALYAEVGLLDESYGMGNFDDDDLSRRVRAAGRLCVRAGGAYVHHEEKASFRELPGWKDAFDENRQRFEARWGKRVRIFMSVPQPGAAVPFPEEAVLELLGDGHWIEFADPGGALPERVRRHAQVSVFEPARGERWRARASLRLLLKRKKPFDLAVSYDPRWSRMLVRLRPFCRARPLEAPDGGTLIHTVRELSRPT